MKILTFEFMNKASGWTLEPAHFGQLNLLVGVSGVGKTRTIEAMAAARAAARGSTAGLQGCEWRIEAEVDGKSYEWIARLGDADPAYPQQSLGDWGAPNRRPCMFLEERLICNDREIIARRRDVGAFQGADLPRFDSTQSILKLFRTESLVEPFATAINGIHISPSGQMTPSKPAVLQFSADDVPDKAYSTVEALRRETALPLMVKAYLLQQQFPPDFERLVESFQAIFPTVIELSFISEAELANGDALPDRGRLLLALKEKNVAGWIDAVSSGMMRTFIHLLELSLVPQNTLVVIDEFENGLGVNCLDHVTDYILTMGRGLQFIITSHHPYIINKFPMKYWRVLHRKGSIVRMINAEEIPALQTKSAHERFMLLLNAPEYAHGVET